MFDYITQIVFVVSGLPYVLWSFLYTAKPMNNTLVLNNSVGCINIISNCSHLCRVITIIGFGYNFFISNDTFHEQYIIKIISIVLFPVFASGLLKTITLLGLIGTFYGSQLGHPYKHCDHWIYKYIPHPMYLFNNLCCLLLTLIMPVYSNLILYIINTIGFIITIFSENLFIIDSYEIQKNI